MIDIKIHNNCGTILLNDPKRCNPLNRRTLEELKQAFDDLRQEKKVRGIILTGAGAHFCSGLDARELKETSESDDALQQWFVDAELQRSLLEQMMQCPKPIIAAVDGAAIGSGFALVLACDLVVASHRATFQIPAARLGLVSGLAVPLLQFRGGAALAARLVIGGQELSAQELKEVGIVHHVVDHEQVWVRASTWIDTIAEGASEAIQLSKKVLNEMVGESLSTMLTSGAAATATALTTEAAQEGLAAFNEKRPPKFE